MDLAIAWNAANFCGDWVTTPGDFATGIDIQTAVLVSLFTDRAAAPDWAAPAGSRTERHGWWGDTYEPSPIGSLLWTLNRAVISDGKVMLSQVKAMCQHALQWLIKDAVAASVTVNTAWIDAQTVGIQVVVTAPQSPPQTFNYSWAWQPSVVGVGG